MSEPPAKRRRVRKGTHSCWECRKRKVKCRFNNPTDSVCINCIERETPCISQKFPDVEASPASPSSASDHPGRTAISDVTDTPSADALSRDPVTRNALCSTEDLLGYSVATHAHSLAAVANREQPLSPDQSPSSEPDATSSDVINHHFILAHQKGAQEQIRQTSRHLHALLPPPDLRGILAHESPGAQWVLSFAQSHDAQVAGTVEPTWSLASASWPLPDTHPVLIAKRLLQFAVCMQYMPPNFDLSRLQASIDCEPCDLLGRLIAAVGSLVANDDELISCAEGIETLVLLSTFQAEAGHLRRAWITNRRALNFCQLMGVSGPSSRHLVRSCAGPKDPATRPSMPVLWRRINCMDRYLSLILGLPVGSHDDSFARAKLPLPSNQLDLLEQEHAVICRKIFDRNTLPPGSADADSLTISINGDLDRASRLMDDGWWATRDFSPGTGRDTSFSGPASRLLTSRTTTTLQVQHFTLLTLLHLPYLVRKNEDDGQQYAESRHACMRASRAVLERFLAFRKNNVMNISGRPIDYSALIAGMTLPLTHLEADDAARIVSDRDLLERTVLIFREMASFKRDRLALESADTISQLLPIVSDGPRKKGQGPLELKVPFLGKVVIKHRTPPQKPNSSVWGGPSPPTSSAETFGGEFAFDPQLFLSLDTDPFGMQGADSLLGGGVLEQASLMTTLPDPNPEDWTFQGVDAVYWSTLGQAVNGFSAEQV